jgi:putative Mn2+ efflux pump MntP
MNVRPFGIDLLLGVDSFVVAAAAETAALRPDDRRRLVWAFAICDGLASSVGAAWGNDWLTGAFTWLGCLGPLAVAVYGIYVFCLAGQARAAARGAGGALSSPSLVVIPLCLSLDNLVLPTVLGSGGWEVLASGVLAGAVSGSLAFAGLRLGEGVGQQLGTGRERLGGLLLLIVACALGGRELWS